MEPGPVPHHEYALPALAVASRVKVRELEDVLKSLKAYHDRSGRVADAMGRDMAREGQAIALALDAIHRRQAVFASHDAYLRELNEKRAGARQAIELTEGALAAAQAEADDLQKEEKKLEVPPDNPGPELIRELEHQEAIRSGPIAVWLHKAVTFIKDHRYKIYAILAAIAILALIGVIVYVVVPSATALASTAVLSTSGGHGLHCARLMVASHSAVQDISAIALTSSGGIFSGWSWAVIAGIVVSAVVGATLFWKFCIPKIMSWFRRTVEEPEVEVAKQTERIEQDEATHDHDLDQLIKYAKRICDRYTAMEDTQMVRAEGEAPGHDTDIGPS